HEFLGARGDLRIVEDVAVRLAVRAPVRIENQANWLVFGLRTDQARLVGLPVDRRRVPGLAAHRGSLRSRSFGWRAGGGRGRACPVEGGLGRRLTTARREREGHHRGREVRGDSQLSWAPPKPAGGPAAPRSPLPFTRGFA